MPSTHFCILCGRDFRPRDADTVICPACGGPPEAPVSAQPQGTVQVEQPKETVLADQPRGTVRMEQNTHQRMCIICGTDFITPDPQADRCPQCRGEVAKPQPGIRSQPESRQPTSAIPARTQGTVAVSESSLPPALSSSTADIPLEWKAGDVILDLYEVKGELGKGGMGVVYRVHHRQWNIDLAVKTPLPVVGVGLGIRLPRPRRLGRGRAALSGHLPHPAHPLRSRRPQPRRQTAVDRRGFPKVVAGTRLSRLRLAASRRRAPRTGKDGKRKEMNHGSFDALSVLWCVAG